MLYLRNRYNIFPLDIILHLHIAIVFGLGLSEIFRRIKPENLTQILHSPIWFDSEFHHGQNLFIKNWFEKGVKNVIDLLDDNGSFLDLK